MLKRKQPKPLADRTASANALRAKRLARNLSQADLASVLGVSKQLVSQYETGHRKITPKAKRLINAAPGR
jgi:transcriptional regulator with XRE-family HTH domain